MASVEAKISFSNDADNYYYLGWIELLLVPDVVWKITHQFSQLIGQQFKNPVMKQQIIGIALQDIDFRLDQNGAELKSEAMEYAAESAVSEFPNNFIFD
jgi:hypothetical protein